VVTLVVQDVLIEVGSVLLVLDVDESWRVTVVVALLVQEVLIEVDSVLLDSPAGVAVLVTEERTAVEVGASWVLSGIFMDDDAGAGAKLDVETGVSLALLEVEARASEDVMNVKAGVSLVLLDEGAALEGVSLTSLALLDDGAGGAALYNAAEVETAAELDVGVEDGSAASFLAGSVPFLIIKRA
jgi:hypothetical protein